MAMKFNNISYRSFHYQYLWSIYWW